MVEPTKVSQDDIKVEEAEIKEADTPQDVVDDDGSIDYSSSSSEEEEPNGFPRYLTKNTNRYEFESVATPLTGLDLVYGTTGFRMDAKYMPCIAFRLGFYTSYYTLKTAVKRAQTLYTGMMITASHNVHSDNGIKAYGPSGTYFTPEDIAEVTKFVNLSDEEFVEEMIMLTKRKENLEDRLFCINKRSHMVIGYDTRKSSKFLRDYVLRGIAQFDTSSFTVHVIARPVTTPLHQYILVSGINLACKNVTQLCELYANSLGERLKNIHGTDPVVVDCANGVGALWADYYFGNKMSSLFNIVNVAYEDYETLNCNCGADYVKTVGMSPLPLELLKPFQRVASFDGDADRLIYSYKDDNDKFVVIDGDYQALLFVDYLYEALKHFDDGELKCGVATTRYANGGFDSAVSNYKDRFTILKGETGVANIVRLVNTLDIGIFFEANGHGSIFFSKKAVELFEEKSSELAEFAAFFQFPIGDAFANLLAIEYVLVKRNMSIAAWRKMFTPMVNTLVKMMVKDLTEYQLDERDRSLLSTPIPLREFMLHTMESKKCRIYIRPSGTETCLRVYVEAEDIDTVNTVLKEVQLKIEELNV